MEKIFLYDGDDVISILSTVKSAVLSFSQSPISSSVMTKRAESLDGGISQIKRWISTSAFRLILIEDLSEASKGQDVSSFLSWLKDHAEDYEGPFIVIREKESRSEVRAVAKEIESLSELSLIIC